MFYSSFTKAAFITKLSDDFTVYKTSYLAGHCAYLQSQTYTECALESASYAHLKREKLLLYHKALNVATG